MKTIKWNNTLKESLLSYIHESAKKRVDARQKIIDAQREFLTRGWVEKGGPTQFDNVPENALKDAAKYFKTDRKDRKLNEVIDAMIKYRMEVDRDKRLPPTRSGSKGDE